jgi:hypothetical protein
MIYIVNLDRQYKKKMNKDLLTLFSLKIRLLTAKLNNPTEF